MASKKPAINRVGIWVRVSTPDQAQGESPEHHLIRGRQYAEMSSLTVVDVYDLAGVSGKTVWDHPECQRMLRDVKRGHIHGLIFSKLARLARNLRELLEFADYFQQYNAHLISLEEKFDTSTPAGRLFFTFIGGIASWEREEITSRINSSISVRAKLGKSLGGKPPYGFKWENQKLIQIPEEAQLRRLAFELFLQHHRKGAVARLLNEKGYRTREGNTFRDKNIRHMLECPSAIGTYRNNQWKAVKGGRQLKSEEEWGTVPCEPIVTPEIYRQTCEVLEHQIKPERKPARQPVTVFAGLLRCGCGGKLYVGTRSPNYTCKKCKNRISIETMDNLFLETIRDELADTGRVSRHLEQARKKISEREAELSLMRKKIEQTKAEMHKVLELYLEGAVTVERFKQIHEPLEERLGQLTTAQPRIEGEITALEVSSLTPDAVAQEGRHIVRIWPTLSPSEKQRLAHLLCTDILIPVNPEDEIVITLTTAHNGTPPPVPPIHPQDTHAARSSPTSPGSWDVPTSATALSGPSDTRSGPATGPSNGQTAQDFVDPEPWTNGQNPSRNDPSGPGTSPLIPPTQPYPPGTGHRPTGYASTAEKILPPSASAPTLERISDSLNRTTSHPNLVVKAASRPQPPDMASEAHRPGRGGRKGGAGAFMPPPPPGEAGLPCARVPHGVAHGFVRIIRRTDTGFDATGGRG